MRYWSRKRKGGPRVSFPSLSFFHIMKNNGRSKQHRGNLHVAFAFDCWLELLKVRLVCERPSRKAASRGVFGCVPFGDKGTTQKKSNWPPKKSIRGLEGNTQNRTAACAAVVRFSNDDHGRFDLARKSSNRVRPNLDCILIFSLGETAVDRCRLSDSGRAQRAAVPKRDFNLKPILKAYTRIHESNSTEQ